MTDNTQTPVSINPIKDFAKNTSALFSLALVYEEAGKLEKATILYRVCGGADATERLLFLLFTHPELQGDPHEFIQLAKLLANVKPEKGKDGEEIAPNSLALTLTAQSLLATCYKKGLLGLEINQFNAFKWRKKTAEAGLVQAMDEVAMCYQKGIGVNPNKIEAFAWAMLALDRRQGSFSRIMAASLELGLDFVTRPGLLRAEMTYGEVNKGLERFQALLEEIPAPDSNGGCCG